MPSKNILIVDDNDLNRKLFEILIGQHFSYTSAKNGLEAVSFAEQIDFDLILMDIQMPQMDGITAMKKIRQAGVRYPIIAVTAYAEESDRASFIQQGFDDFILKPIRPKNFIRLIQNHLEGAGSDHPGLANQRMDYEILDKNILNQLLKYNSKAVIKRLFGEFITECEELEMQLKNSPTDLNDAVVLEKIHSIKGNSGTLGAMRVFTAASLSEKYARNFDFSSLEKELINLTNEIRQLSEFLKQELIFEP